MNKLFLLCAGAAIVSAPAFALIWSEPVLLAELNEPTQNAYHPHLSRDGVTLYFGRRNPDASNVRRLYTAQRDPDTGVFSNVTQIDELQDTRNLYSPWVSDDDLRLYYGRYEGGTTRIQLRMAERNTVSDPWVRTIVFNGIHILGYNDVAPSLTADELTMYYTSDRGNAKDDTRIWMATRSSIDQQFSNPMKAVELDRGNRIGGPCLLPDGLTLYYAENVNGQYDLFRATRNSLAEPFSNIEPLSLNTPLGIESTPYVTPDESELFFVSEEGIWYAQQIPEPATIGLLALGAGLIRKRK